MKSPFARSALLPSWEFWGVEYTKGDKGPILSPVAKNVEIAHEDIKEELLSYFEPSVRSQVQITIKDNWVDAFMYYENKQVGFLAIKNVEG